MGLQNLPLTIHQEIIQDETIRALLCLALCFSPALADTGVNKATQKDKAFAKYGLTGKGVIVAFLDRGIDYTHPDFLNSNGTTRIKMMWDMSNVNPSLPICDPGQPAPIVYNQAQINQALSTNTPLGERDAVGHGTVGAGLAAGNGRAALPTSSQWAGMAPNADLLIVKMTSEGAPAHSGQAAENLFQGCMSLALDLVTKEAATLKEPIVALMDSGTQWGPIDGTSAVSQKINADFNSAGHIYVAASGDEGTSPNHAQLTYSTAPAVFNFNKTSTLNAYSQIWYTRGVPANVTLRMSDTSSTATVAPGNNCVISTDATITLCTYLPGQQFYPVEVLWARSRCVDKRQRSQRVGHDHHHGHRQRHRNRGCLRGCDDSDADHFLHGKSNLGPVERLFLNELRLHFFD